MFVIERFSSARLRSQGVLPGHTAPQRQPLSLGVPQGSGLRRAAAGSGSFAVWEYTSLLLVFLLARWGKDGGLETKKPCPILRMSPDPHLPRRPGPCAHVCVHVGGVLSPCVCVRVCACPGQGVSCCRVSFDLSVPVPQSA